MKNRILVAVFFMFHVSQMEVLGQRLLEQKVNSTELDYIVAQVDTWRKNKAAAWIQTIHTLPEQEKQRIITSAEDANGFSWPSLLASTYMEFKLNGNRTNYQDDVNRRRSMLSRLVLGELVERKGRFIPQIANGLWLTLEESTWVSPAHIIVQKTGAGLPDPNDSYIDLAAGAVAADLASIYVLLKEDLDRFSPQISKKIYKGLEGRILIPYAEREDFWWMNAKAGTLVNNWNIWINTNVLKTALLVDAEPDRLKKLLGKLMISADKFIDFYPADGACEEGPSYWGHSAGELGLMIEWLQEVSGERISFKNEDKIHRMGSYILQMHVTGDRFLNFADAEAIQVPSPAKIWKFGELYDDDSMKSLAVYLDRMNKNTLSLGSVQGFLMTAQHYYDLTSKEAIDIAKEPTHYYESLQLATFRSGHRQGDLFFAAIGGNNGVSHNHNDAGSFMLYLDSLPILIDIGVGTYTGETFSSRRYSLWNMQSQWHNLPIINGIQQKNGKAYAAKDVKVNTRGKSYHYELDISDAYPEEARVKSWKRSFDFYPGNNILQISERFELLDWKQASEVVLMTPVPPKIDNNTIQLPLIAGKQATVAFDSSMVEAIVEEKVVEDPRIVRAWGEKVYRIKLVVKGKKVKGDIKYTIKIE